MAYLRPSPAPEHLEIPLEIPLARKPAFPSALSPRLLRAGLVLLAGWLLLEAALLQLVAARIGWGLTLAILSIKGGIGLVLVAVLAWRGFHSIRAGAGTRPGERSLRAGFGVASGILITLPGLVPPLVGLALFSPSLQEAIIARFRAPRPSGVPRQIDLSEEEWQETRRRKLTQRRRKPKSMA